MFNLTLPSGKSISVRPPTFKDRMNAARDYRSAKDPGYILEELLAAFCIDSINGTSTSLDTYIEPIMRMSDWLLQDVNYYLEFFMSAFYPDEKMREEAQKKAKNLFLTGTTEDVQPEAQRSTKTPKV